jgi:hypothetical protein
MRAGDYRVWLQGEKKREKKKKTKKTGGRKKFGGFFTPTVSQVQTQRLRMRAQRVIYKELGGRGGIGEAYLSLGARITLNTGHS